VSNNTVKYIAEIQHTDMDYPYSYQESEYYECNSLQEAESYCDSLKHRRSYYSVVSFKEKVRKENL